MTSTAQASLFDRVMPVSGVRATVARVGDPDGLRPYQRQAVEAILRELSAGYSTMAVMATGTGKTQTFGAVAKHWAGRVLVLAHRKELIDQARGRLAEMTGEFVGVEKAARAAVGERIVIGSVQTLKGIDRLLRFPPGYFALIIIDEAHHAVATSYRLILNHFTGAKVLATKPGEAHVDGVVNDTRVLGVTATADRADALAMEQVFSSVAFRYDIDQGQADGYLVPVEILPVAVAGIELAAVKTTAGDFNQGQLEAIMGAEKVLHGVCNEKLFETCGDRRTIGFATSVANAKAMAEIMNRHRPGCARWVCGKTPEAEREAILGGHKRGEYQFLFNVGVLTEGYDDPAISCILMVRPTKSRALYAQMLGRGLRPAPGKVDCLVLDFTGNSGKHKLVSALDILGGRWSEDVIARAKANAAKKGSVAQRSEEALRKAAAELEAEEAAEVARRARIVATKVEWKIGAKVDPFSVLGISDDGEFDSRSPPIQVDQVRTLEKFKIDVPDGCTRAQAGRLIQAAIVRMKKGLATYKQIKKLSQFGIAAQRMYMSTASKLMDAIAKNGWRDLPAARVAEIIASRQTGEDG